MRLFSYSTRIFYALCIITTTSANFFYPNRIILPRKTCTRNIQPSLPTSRAASLIDILRMANEQLPNRFSSQQEVDKLNSPLQKSAPPMQYELEDPSNVIDDDDKERNMAYECSKLQCPPELMMGPVCACNYKTGNVVSFKNNCELKKHNCRFDTGFKVILQEICPWEYESRRAGEEDRIFDYSDAKYQN